MTLTVEMKDYEVVRRGLLELPAKDSMMLIARLDQQVVAQTQPKKEKDGGK